MKSRKILVSSTIDLAKSALKDDDTLSTQSKIVIEKLVEVVSILSNKLGLNSSNSSKPPSTDPFRNKKHRNSKGEKKKPGGQKGHKGTRLFPVDIPTSVEIIVIDRRTLPPGKWKDNGFEKRQVFDIEVAFNVVEYQAEMLINEAGEIFVAQFPEGVSEPAQYGNGVKATSVYLSQFQLIPQARVQDLLSTQYDLPIAKGSINNFNAHAARILRTWNFEEFLREVLVIQVLLHADETGANLNGKLHWIHCLSNEAYTYFHIDQKRGKEAMDRMGVLSQFKGKLVHDHWKPYFAYICIHILCNAHHLRELERAYEQDNQQWAKNMKDLLEAMNSDVNNSGGSLSDKKIETYQKKYRNILKLAEKECPENQKKRAQSKSRNLLERLISYEEETLRFMKEENVPFTNNQGERDLRMNKVHQKISGCFRSERGARDFCLIRSYLSTCRKQGIHPMEALRFLFEGKKPEFMK